MPHYRKRQGNVRAWILLAIGLGASTLEGCAAGTLKVTVDAYKGPLSNHGDTVVLQAASLAEAARLQLTSIRGSYLTRQEFKAFIPGSEVWAINRLLELYDDPALDPASDTRAGSSSAGQGQVETAVQSVEKLLGTLEKGTITEEQRHAFAKELSGLIADAHGGSLGVRTRAEIAQMAYAWIRNREELLRKITDSSSDREKKEAKKRFEEFRHQMIDVLTNAGAFRVFSQRVPLTPARKRGVDHLIDEWQRRLEAKRAASTPSGPALKEQLEAEELQARERLLDGLTVLGEAMRALSLVVGGTEFLEKARGGTPQVDDPVDLQFMATMDAFGNALLFAADSARQAAGFSRHMDIRPPEASGQTAKTETEWRRARSRALDTKRAELEDQLLKSLAEGVEDRGGSLGEKDVDARAKARGTERAIRFAQTMRPPLERLRPAGEYLRAQQPGRILLEGLGENPKLKEATDRLTQVFDNLYWERANKVEAKGLAKANYVLYKDDIGNWNLKAYSDDRTLLVKAVFGSIIAAADVALAAASGGSTAVTELLRKRVETLKQTSATASVSADTIRRQIAEARVRLVSTVLPQEQKPGNVRLTDKKFRDAVEAGKAQSAIQNALRDYQKALDVIRAGTLSSAAETP